MSQSLSSLDDGPSYSFEHDFLTATPRKLIEDLNESAKVQFINLIPTFQTI